MWMGNHREVDSKWDQRKIHLPQNFPGSHGPFTFLSSRTFSSKCVMFPACRKMFPVSTFSEVNKRWQINAKWPSWNRAPRSCINGNYFQMRWLRSLQKEKLKLKCRRQQKLLSTAQVFSASHFLPNIKFHRPSNVSGHGVRHLERVYLDFKQTILYEHNGNWNRNTHVQSRFPMGTKGRCLQVYLTEAGKLIAGIFLNNDSQRQPGSLPSCKLFPCDADALVFSKKRLHLDVICSAPFQRGRTPVRPRLVGPFRYLWHEMWDQWNKTRDALCYRNQ